MKLVLILFVLVAICVAIHGAGTVIGLRWISKDSTLRPCHSSLLMTFWVLTRVVFGLLILHLLQILAWAVCYELDSCFPDFATSFYYSATSYSTVGYGDVIPPGNWRVFGAIEAVTGVLMFGWSAGILFSIVNRLMGRFVKISHHENHTP